MLHRAALVLLVLAALAPTGVGAQQDGAPPPCLSPDERSTTPAPRPQGALFLDAFTRFDAAPVLQNAEEMTAALHRVYPAAHRAAGVGGQTYLWILVDPDGAARRAQVNITSGCPELDDAAMRASEVMRFSPAVFEGRTVPVWILIAINFDPAAAGAAPAAAASGEISEDPSFTPFTVAPVVQNREEVAAAVRREYPRELRDELVNGRTTVWVRLDVLGQVEDVQINATSGNATLDEAALRVARVIRFSPALDLDGPVPVWISIPIQFQP
jgi:TonB family protein